jgi:hypothetical protein
MKQKLNLLISLADAKSFGVEPGFEIDVNDRTWVITHVTPQKDGEQVLVVAVPLRKPPAGAGRNRNLED